MRYTDFRKLGIAVLGIVFILASICPAVFASDQGQTTKETEKPKAESKQIECKGPRKRLAVMDMTSEVKDDHGRYYEFVDLFKNATNNYTSADVGRKLTEMLTTALVNSGCFNVVERAAIQDLRDEIKIGEELATKETATKAGSVLGAQVLVRASVTEFQNKDYGNSGGINVGNLKLGGKNKRAKVVVDVRMYDALTSEVLASERAEGLSDSKSINAGVIIGTTDAKFGEDKNDPIEKATRDAIEKAVLVIIDKMRSVPWEGKVALVKADGDKTKIYINRGKLDGVNVGDRFVIAHPGEEVKDPDTGLVLDRAEDKVVGYCKVISVTDKLATAESEAPGEYQNGDIAKLP